MPSLTGRLSFLTRVEVRRFQHVVNGFGMHPEGTPHPNGWQLTVMHQPIHRHLGDPHEHRDFGHGEKLCSDLLALNGAGFPSPN